MSRPRRWAVALRAALLCLLLGLVAGGLPGPVPQALQAARAATHQADQTEEARALRHLLEEIAAVNAFFSDLHDRIDEVHSARAWIADALALGMGWDEAAMNGRQVLPGLHAAIPQLGDRASALSVAAPDRPPFYNYTPTSVGYAVDGVDFLRALVDLLEQDVAAVTARDIAALFEGDEQRAALYERDLTRAAAMLAAELAAFPEGHPTRALLMIAQEHIAVEQDVERPGPESGPDDWAAYQRAVAARNREAAARIDALIDRAALALDHHAPAFRRAIATLFAPASGERQADAFLASFAREIALTRGYVALYRQSATLHEQVARGEEGQALYEAFVRLDADWTGLARDIDKLFVARYDRLLQESAE